METRVRNDRQTAGHRPRTPSRKPPAVLLVLLAAGAAPTHAQPPAEAPPPAVVPEDRGTPREVIEAEIAAAAFRTDAARRAFARGLRQSPPDADLAGVRNRAEAVRGALLALEASLLEPPFAPTPEGSAIDAGTLRLAVDTRRERAVAELAEAAIAADAERVAAGVAKQKAWEAEALAYVAEVLSVEASLANALAPDEAPEDGGAAWVVAAGRARELPAARELGVAAGAIFRRVDRLAELMASDDPADLTRAVRDAAAERGRRVAELLVAWERLAELPWPRDPEGLKAAERLLADAVLPDAARLPGDARRAAARERAFGAARRLWSRYVSDGAPDGPAQAAAFAASAAFDVREADIDALPTWARANILRWRLERAAERAVALRDDAQTPALQLAIRDYVREARRAGADREPAIADLVARLAPLLDPQVATGLAGLGPGTAGWRLASAAPDGSVATYALTTPGGERTLEFRRVEVAGSATAAESTVAYLARSEASVGLVADIVAAGGSWETLRPLLPAFTGPADDPRRGPRSWTVGRRRGESIVPSTAMPGDTSRGWLRPRPGMRDEPYYPDSSTVEPPSAESPVQHVPPVAALAAARAMGCRLPTVAEWRAASVSPQSGEAPNRRDAAWADVHAHLRPLAGASPEWPSGGIFRPAGAGRVQPLQDGDPAVDGTDGLVWFAPVTAGDAPFRHLVGNVAEFVVEDAGPLDAATADGGGASEALLAAAGLRVIGASALSPPGVRPEDASPVPLPPARAGYSDVGFRPAFSAPRGTSALGIAARLRAALGPESYLERPAR